MIPPQKKSPILSDHATCALFPPIKSDHSSFPGCSFSALWTSSPDIFPEMAWGYRNSLPFPPAAAAKSLQLPNSVQPHRQQPTSLPRPWDSPGKNTGVGCHFLLQCLKVKSESEVTQLCLTLSNPMDCSLPGSSVRGVLQARALEWVAISFSNA